MSLIQAARRGLLGLSIGRRVAMPMVNRISTRLAHDQAHSNGQCCSMKFHNALKPTTMDKMLLEKVENGVENELERRMMKICAGAVKILCDQYFTDACLVGTTSMSEGLQRKAIEHERVAGLKVTELIDAKNPDEPLKGWMEPYAWISVNDKVVDICSNTLPYVQHAVQQGINIRDHDQLRQFFQKPQETFEIPSELTKEVDNPLIGSVCVMGKIYSLPSLPTSDPMTLRLYLINYPTKKANDTNESEPELLLRVRYMKGPEKQGASENEMRKCFDGILPSQQTQADLDVYDTVMKTQSMYTRLIPTRIKKGVHDAIVQVIEQN